MYVLRPYQEAALETVRARLEEAPDVLLQACTGAGKTIVFAELSRRLIAEYPGIRIGIMAHRRELVLQACDKLVRTWPEGVPHIGVACAAAGRVDTEKAVTVGSVQTMARRLFPEPFDLLVVDEAHHVPHVEYGGQYHDVISGHRAARPGMRVLGVTATPFRTGHGYIYGDRCREGRTNPFPRLDFSVTLDDLVKDGHLCPVRFKVPVDLAEDLSRVRVRRGEYDERSLGEMMSRPLHLSSALDAYRRYGEGRGKALAFAVTVEHAQALAKVLSSEGPAAAVHYRLDKWERTAILRDFDRGGLRFLVNVGILTEGWDSPAIDLILMCRPTMSPGLFVQMVGRGTRTRPGKDSVLVLDLADNRRRHGDPSSPSVRWGSETGEAPMKLCPECKELVPLSARECPSCGHGFGGAAEEKEKAVVDVSPKLVEITAGRMKRETDAPLKVLDWSLAPHVSRAGNRMARLDVFLDGRGRPVTHFLDFEGKASAAGRTVAWTWWTGCAVTDSPLPSTVDEAVARAPGEIRLPDTVKVETRNGFRKVTGW